MTPGQLSFFFEELARMFPNAGTELHYTTPFQLLVAVVLSAQTTDKQVNKVTAMLFQTIQTPTDILAWTFPEREQALSSLNLYKTKAKHLRRTAEILTDSTWQSRIAAEITTSEAKVIKKKWGYIIPDTVSGLMELPGVGEKSAKVIGASLFHLPIIGVDTHVHRVVHRIGLLQTNNPLQTSAHIEKVIPQHFLATAHHRLVLFGRYRCKAKKPLCSSCPFSSFCLWYAILPT